MHRCFTCTHRQFATAKKKKGYKNNVFNAEKGVYKPEKGCVQHEKGYVKHAKESRKTERTTVTQRSSGLVLKAAVYHPIASPHQFFGNASPRAAQGNEHCP